MCFGFTINFVAGLLPALKMKVDGVDGKFDEILVKACFEKAKLRELSAASVLKPEMQLTAPVPGPPLLHQVSLLRRQVKLGFPQKTYQPSAKPFKCTVWRHKPYREVLQVEG